MPSGGHSKSGRKRKPASLKILEGTFRKNEMGDEEAVRSTDPAAPPEWLPVAAHKHFYHYIDLTRTFGYDSDTFSAVFGLLAMRLMELDECNSVIDAYGIEIPAESTKKPAALGYRSDLLKEIQKLLNEVGLTPCSAGRIATVKEQKEYSEREAGFGGL